MHFDKKGMPYKGFNDLRVHDREKFYYNRKDYLEFIFVEIKFLALLCTLNKR